MCSYHHQPGQCQRQRLHCRERNAAVSAREHAIESELYDDNYLFITLLQYLLHAVVQKPLVFRKQAPTNTQQAQMPHRRSPSPTRTLSLCCCQIKAWKAGHKGECAAAAGSAPARQRRRRLTRCAC
jgi:hypothetical protein